MLKQWPIIVVAVCALAAPLHAQSEAEIPPSVVTPDQVETSRGTFEFRDGVPTDETARALYDQHDFTFAYRAFMDTLRGVSIRALRRGMEEAGVKENEVMVFSELMDANSLFLTPNADTIYVMGWLDLSDGPVVIESPPEFLGIVQDAWFHWVTDLGNPGPDRGLGGKYLIVPPGYDGEWPPHSSHPDAPPTPPPGCRKASAPSSASASAISRSAPTSR